MVTGTVSVELESLGMSSPEIPLVASKLIDVTPDEMVMAAPYAGPLQLDEYRVFRADSIVVENLAMLDRIRIVSPAFGQIDIGVSEGATGEVVTVGPPPWIVRAA